MDRRKIVSVVLITIAVVGTFVLWQAKTSDQATVFAQGVGNHWTMTAGTYRFPDSPELSTIVLLDSQTGKTYFLRVRSAKTSDGHVVNAVEWAPIVVAAQ